MSFESERPPGPRPVLQRRARGPLVPTLVVLGVLVVLGLLFASTWTDILWYRQVGFFDVYRTELVSKIVLFLLGALVMGGAVLASLVVAYRSQPIYAPVSPEQQSLDRYRESIEPLRRVVVVALPATLALFAGSAAAQQWQTVLLWWNRVPFGRSDAQFGLDVGFFVFTLPFLQFVTGFLTAVVFLSALAAVVTHYLYGGLRLQGGGARILPAARIHLSVLAAVFLLLRAVDYWLGRYALTTKSGSRITGLQYTDANAVLTARGVLAAIAVVIAALFLVGLFVDRWRVLPLYGVALLVVSAIVIEGIYPAAVQRFQVRPNESQLEQEYIQRAITATRDAYGLSDIEVIPYNAQSEATAGALRDSTETIPGIRLLDPAIVSDAFRQLQQIRPYYSFPDSLDVDRYTIDGQSRDTVVAVRELNLDQVQPSDRNWVNDHTFYTHGFGVVAAFGNEQRADGRPSFFQSGIPSSGALPEYEPRIYFGEQSPEYSIVGAPEGSAPRELDYPDSSESGEQRFTYDGEGGVHVGSFLNRLLYAIKFREQNILLSDSVNSESQILYDRQPRQRVQKVAPFLTLDGDPYPTVVDGRIKWIIDGYTTTSRYPYSATQVLQDATSDSLTATSSSVVALQAQRVNYMRNSVKATVDAYDGTVTLYAWDEEDPVLQAWQKIFPDAVQPLSQIDGELMSHLRYPEDLFKVQRQLLQRYHVTNAGAFFGAQDFWQVPNDPAKQGTNQLQPPYYLTLQMPNQDEASFSLTSTFIPVSGTRNILTGFLAVDADAGAEAGQKREGYGQMRLLQLPRDSSVPGPGQVANTFTADPDVSQALNVLRVGGSSQVELGNLLTLPVGGGLLYVQPVYVRASGGTSFPLLQRVLVAFGQEDEVGFAPTLQAALNQVFGGDAGVEEPPADGGTPPDDGGTPPADQSAQQRLQDALADASAALRAGQEALAQQDFAAYGRAQDQLRDAIARATQAEAEVSGAAGGDGATPAPSPTPTETATP